MENVGGDQSRRYRSSLTLGGILSIKQTPPYRIRDRTLLDLIRDDQNSGNESKKTWKIFREKLRLILAGSVCTTAVPILLSHVHITTDGNRITTRNVTTQQNSTGESTWRPPVTNNSSVQDTQTVNLQTEPPVELTEVDRGGGGEPATVRMSLMSLLEVDVSTYLDDGGNDGEEAEEVVAVAEGGDGGCKYNNCCVCMVRHKGAAFIPCGHTFCRLCSRELFVKKASCPLCKNFILGVLDIF